MCLSGGGLGCGDSRRAGALSGGRGLGLSARLCHACLSRGIGLGLRERMEGGTSLPRRSGANPQGAERGLRSPHPPPKKVPVHKTRLPCDEQDPVFGRDGVKSTSRMPFLCKAFLLPPHLAVALLTSSPGTEKSHTHTCGGHTLN